MDPEYNYKLSKRSPGRTRSYGKRVLAVRAMAGETAWLDGRIVWHEGRVFWESQGRLFAPAAGDLSLAQRRLNQIQRYPLAGQQALDDLSAWLARRCARLEIAKRVYLVRMHDFVSVSQYLREPDAPSIERLSALLLAESVCANALPMSAARMMAAYGERAQPAVCAILSDRSLPGIARALAALTLAAIHKQIVHTGSVSRCAPPAAIQDTEWMQRAYSWGLRLGMPGEPTLYVRLLSDEDGASLARRYAVAAQVGAPFQLDAGLLQDLLGAGTPPKKVVSLAESLLALVPLSNLVLDYRDLLPDKPAKKRHETAERLQAERQAILADLAETLQGYIRSTPDPAVVEAFAQIAYMVLELGEPVEQSVDHLLAVLRDGLSLPAAHQRSYLEMLIEHREQMWDESCRRSYAKGADWLLYCYTEHIQPWLALLDTTKNAEIVREAIQLGISYVLGDCRWQELDRYRCVLSLARDLDLREDYHLARRLCGVVGNFTDVQAAHLALQSVMRPLMRLGTELRREVVRGTFYEVPYSRQGQRQALSKLLPYFPRLVDFVTEDTKRMQLLAGLVQCTFQVSDFGVAENQRAIWLDWVLTYLVERAQRLEDGYADLPWILPAANVAFALAAGDFTHFQAIFRAAIEHDLDYQWERVEAGLRVFSRNTQTGGYRHLRTVLAGMFPRQPHRCVKLIEQIGLLPRLGKQALATLASLEPEGEELSTNLDALIPADWQPLIVAVPGLLPDVHSYLRAQQVLGGDDRLPPALRRIVEQPSRWAGELTYLQALLKSHPERADLAIRERNLISRLADSEATLRNMRGELTESLQQLAAEAELAAIERQIEACYHQYLESISGLEAVQVELNEDLLNAALLMTDIKSNRRLLLKLLRGYLGGQRRWPEQHPTNVDYLEKLAAMGVDVRGWLRARPRVYRCKGIAGGRAHLRLERDPLSILQMGNYFSTCLRFGGVNAFSTVANACELNKRVIYARDGKGSVVGRKLIGISSEGKLVGFQTYSSVEEDAGGKELRVLFNRYAAEFARRCGLELADEGTVPRLFAQDWYDDGAVPWASEEQPAGSGHKGRKGRAIAEAPPADSPVLVRRRRTRLRVKSAPSGLNAPGTI